MKNIFFTSALILAANAWANLEHATGMEASPTQARLASTRACFDEMERLGCGHPREDLERFKECSRASLSRVKADCRALVQKLYGAP